ncbi:MAG: NADH dehydrogenase (quinone) subunit D [Deltaproteobacteria bacterium RIFCSPLOWO2_12_FULL_40_28]|nr:MAG: NADH dehydrogenase (quinone) subunit D [Deltaproteobacteria bacterium RIFCSPHIGHO2_02_FULL_40_28]OGQ19905.1 MAG: NADH dehydrogenase (quinone) subunit D [Deltaproteobacteria bacterium RIFCSPHIGHO2_12_FULL_40_32]OGQ39664.1 MAG: NADH dehydrogenase (quinone) subunit D [Deltaproteobacteria bacterium RIFCSPLOWO2_02_FULL_40_36]OGQ52920.1 MAG: NADH dehydrogenase (quinone) subunit D [Deltaproteobacteria bacterium RIFCSPLOWO2_12_FULL_40_28]
MPALKQELESETMLLNVGPSHPAMHGALRTQMELDGERIVGSASEIGYLHRCFEKHSECSTYQQIIPYTDRLNYLSALMNNVGYCMAVEKLLKIEAPDRAIIIRVIMCELSRIMDHFVCVGTNLVDIGALTNFWFFFNIRERIYNLIEMVTGARLTYSYTRIGGVARDLYPAFAIDCRIVLKEVEQAVKDVLGLIQHNRILVERTVDVGVVTKEQAIEWGFTGPCLRASGYDHDLRKAEPYYFYDQFDFDIPIAENGDSYDRIMVRMEEVRQSTRIVLQALEKLPSGLIMTDAALVSLPPKEEVYGSIEGLMNHFKLIMHGILPPKGEIYSATEAANGELGFYIVSQGGASPYRIKVRPPCFPIFAVFDKMIKGLMVADAIAILGGLNVVVGELDR